MILADTSVWANHFRHGVPLLHMLLGRQRILGHPLVIGELALGNLQPREETIERLMALPAAMEASHRDTIAFIGSERLFGTGVGLVDVHLLMAAQLSDAKLWTADKRLLEAATRLNLAYEPS